MRILEDTWRVGLNPTGNPFQFLLPQQRTRLGPRTGNKVADGWRVVDHVGEKRFNVE